MQTALTHTYRVVLPAESNRTLSPKLGFSAPSYNSMFVRDYWTLFALAVDGEFSLDELIMDQKSDMWARFDREQVVECALALARAVGELPAPVQDVVLLRASGLSWARMVRARPGRAYWSMVDDWKAAAATLSERCGDAIDVLQGAVNERPARRARG